jgi:hypothetical protein
MTIDRKATVLVFALAMLLLTGPMCVAQKKAPAQSAPVPAQILAAKKIFIANGGGDESIYDEAAYTGGPDRLYDEFYAAMKTSGRYELVSAPGDADLILEVRLTIFQLQHVRVLSDDSPLIDSQFQLVIREPRTGQTLWGRTEHAQGAVLQSNRDKNFEQALAAIVADVQKIAGPPADS